MHCMEERSVENQNYCEINYIYIYNHIAIYNILYTYNCLMGKSKTNTKRSKSQYVQLFEHIDMLFSKYGNI